VQKHCDELYLFFLQLLVDHAIYLKDFFELFKNFNAPPVLETSRTF
jgi:hypothetical protein